MVIFDIRVAKPNDVPSLVALANQYTYQNLSEQNRQSGFLTGVFSYASVQAMIASASSIVAFNQEELAGFIINTRLPASQYPPLVQEIIKELPKLTFGNKPVEQYHYFFYGPVLVAHKYRNQGLLRQMRQMLQKTKEELKSNFNLGIAFIDQANVASYRVHTEHLGFENIGEITFNNRKYAILVFSLL
ncbi:MAG: hypothetical protein M3142_14940 [Bacteroidota bacterium]|nr:hypothetical protein [Bacteroidota bacterium]